MTDHYSHPDPTVRELLEQAKVDGFDLGLKVGVRLSRAIRESIGDESQAAGMYQ